MPKSTRLILLAICLSLLARAAEAKVINLRDAPFSAAGDGKADDRAALIDALKALEPGDTLLVPPGAYRIELTKGQINVPARVTILGQGDKSYFLLESDDGPEEYREFLRLGSQVTLEGIDIVRTEDFPLVVLPIFGEVSGPTLRGVTIRGLAGTLTQGYCHAIQLGGPSLKNLRIEGSTIRDCSYGLFQASAATGSTDGVTVVGSRFEDNTASDLEFNSPNGRMRNIRVRDCTFRDNRCKSPSAGFAVGLAHVEEAWVENCRIENYGSEALHVEDRSAVVHLVGNTIVGCSKLQPNGVVMVLSGSTRVHVERNYIDGRPNENRPHLVLVTAGGDRFACPKEVSVVENVLVNGPKTRTWYLQPGSGPEPKDNVVVEPAAAEGP